MSSNGEIREQVRAFILKQFPLAQRASLDDKKSLVECGIIDSMGVLELVTFIESDFEIVLSDEDVVLMYGQTEAFRSTYLPPSELDQRPTSIGKATGYGDSGSQRCGPALRRWRSW